MPTEILMPALSPTMEEGTLAKWLVKEGDEVNSGDLLAEIETDKATMEFEAVDEGVIGKIFVAEGTEGVKVNTPIAALLGEGESASDVSAPEIAPDEPKESEKPGPDTEVAEKSEPTTKAKDAPAAPQFKPQDDPDIPDDVEMVTITVREALRLSLIHI